MALYVLRVLPTRRYATAMVFLLYNSCSMTTYCNTFFVHLDEPTHQEPQNSAAEMLNRISVQGRDQIHLNRPNCAAGQ